MKKAEKRKAGHDGRPRKVKTNLRAEMVAIADLHPHPRNYRQHPDDQLAHLIESLRTFGVYRNVVIAKDGTILAGHGVVQAAKKAGLRQLPAIKLNVGPNDPSALKVLVGDNEMEHLAEQDDRLLSELLKEVKEKDAGGLLGTGFDEMMLANFIMVTRPESEITDFDAAAQWVGLPEYDGKVPPLHIIVNFRSKGDRCKFGKKLGISITDKARYIWYPEQEREDPASLKVEG